MHIDWWTLAFQTVNVIILIWILGRFFFRPVVDIVANRQAQANKILADAAAARRQASDARAEADKARAQIIAERERVIAEATKAAQAEKARLLAHAADEIAKLRGEAEAAIARDRSAARQAIIARASELAVRNCPAPAWTAAAGRRPVHLPRRALSGAARTVSRRQSELYVGRRRSCHRGRDASAALERRDGAGP